MTSLGKKGNYKTLENRERAVLHFRALLWRNNMDLAQAISSRCGWVGEKDTGSRSCHETSEGVGGTGLFERASLKMPEAQIRPRCPA